MPLRCPRCQTFLEIFNRHGGGPDDHIEADMCLACGGVWLDGGEAAQAYPGLAALDDRRGDVLAAGEAGAGIASCPRCEMPTVEVPFFDVKLDICTACYGVWVDGEEIEAVSRAMDRNDGFPVPPEVVGGYRTAAAGVMTKHVATCVTCGTEVPFRTTRGTPKGALCQACAKEADAAADLAFIEGGPAPDGEDDYVVPKESGVWGFVCDVGSALGAVLQMAPHCNKCGCRRASGCSC